MIDRDAVGIQLDGLLDAPRPVLFRLAQHAGDQVDIDLRKVQRPGELIGPEDFGRAMGAAVDLENPIVEVLDAKAEPRDAHVANGRELALRESAGLALKRHFLSGVPGAHRLQTPDKSFKLAH